MMGVRSKVTAAAAAGAVMLAAIPAVADAQTIVKTRDRNPGGWAFVLKGRKDPSVYFLHACDVQRDGRGVLAATRDFRGREVRAVDRNGSRSGTRGCIAVAYKHGPGRPVITIHLTRRGSTDYSSVAVLSPRTTVPRS